VLSTSRVRTGIRGLDRLIGGGLPGGYCYLVLGGPGAGKTTFGIQYLVKGIIDDQETGIYVTFDEPPFSLMNNVRESFGWDLSGLEARQKLAIVDASPMEIDVSARTLRVKGSLGTEDFSIDSVLGLVSEAKRRVTPPAKRCVIDSISGLLFQYESPFQQRQQLLKLMKGLTEMRLTTLLLGELPEETIDYQRFGPEAFLAQGVFVMHNIRTKNTITQVFQIRKLRGQKFSKEMIPYNIGEQGVEVYPGDKVFT